MASDSFPFRLDTMKAAQAVAVLVRRSNPHSKQDNYTRILKLLYLAERKCLQERGRPLLGDKVCAMKHGPVMSGVYNLVSRQHPKARTWSPYIEKCRFDLRLLEDPGVDLLSPYEITLLESVADEYANQDQWQLIDICHELAEYKKNDPRKDPNGPQSIPISVQDIMTALGMSDRIEDVLALANERRAYERTFKRPTPTSMRFLSDEAK